MPSLEQNILDLHKVVERCTKEVEKETMKREQIVQEN